MQEHLDNSSSVKDARKTLVGGGGDLVDLPERFKNFAGYLIWDLDGTVPKVDQHMLRLDRRGAKIVLAIQDASLRCVGTGRPKPPPAGQGRRRAASVRPRRQRRTYTQQSGNTRLNSENKEKTSQTKKAKLKKVKPSSGWNKKWTGDQNGRPTEAA